MFGYLSKTGDHRGPAGYRTVEPVVAWVLEPDYARSGAPHLPSRDRIIAPSFVELQQGRIWAESAGPGRGSTFSFELPIAPAPCDRGQASE